MSTRSTIGTKIGDKYVAIYCHSDGYPAGVQNTLVHCYETIEKVEALLALGNISYLEGSIECPEGHSFDKPVDGYTVAYHRDRGEDYERYEFSTIAEWEPIKEEYNYLFQDDKWYCLENKEDLRILGLKRKLDKIVT
jgi:hypothetical protein